jgi:hypothetical protein
LIGISWLLGTPFLIPKDFLTKQACSLATAPVAVTGNIYAGLCYPVIVALMSLVIGVIFLRETKDRNSDSGYELQMRRICKEPCPGRRKHQATAPGLRWAAYRPAATKDMNTDPNRAQPNVRRGSARLSRNSTSAESFRREILKFSHYHE